MTTWTPVIAANYVLDETGGTIAAEDGSIILFDTTFGNWSAVSIPDTTWTPVAI